MAQARKNSDIYLTDRGPYTSKYATVEAQKHLVGNIATYVHMSEGYVRGRRKIREAPARELLL